jgi:UDP-glucose 4-epimerase
MNILITGGFGYIGGRLAKAIVANTEHRVILGSRIPKSAPSALHGATSVVVQWDSPESLNRITHGIDVVIHAAGMNAQDCENNPSAAFQVNSIATSNLLEAAIKQKVGRFIYLSTIHVYGAPLAGRITEDNPTTGTHPYATSHKAGEDAVLMENKKGNIKGVVVRLSNAFGAPVHNDVNCWMLLVNDLCKQAVKHNRLTLNSSGEQRRDFIPLTDVCRVIIHLTDCRLGDQEDHLFNVGGDWSPTILKITEKFAKRYTKLTGMPLKIKRNKDDKSSFVGALDYSIEKLISTGFMSSKDNSVNQELDGLIHFCLENKD